jgi:hypothetical protein
MARMYFIRLVILLNAAALLSCSDEAASCPDQILDPSSAPCCVDDRVCEQVEPRGYFGDTIAVALETLCSGRCEPDLETALASPACDSVRIGCGLTEVHAFVPGFIFATPVYDSETGELVGARGNSNEGYTRKLDGCCGAEFQAGATLASCAEVTDGACTETE